MHECVCSLCQLVIRRVFVWVVHSVDFSVSIFPCYSLGICYLAQLCGQTQEWLTDRGTPNCAWSKSPPTVNTFAWLGLAWLGLAV